MAKRAAKQAQQRPPAYEELIARLEAIIERLEGSKLTLDEAITAYEKGAALAGQCQTLLDRAEQRIHELRQAEDG